LLTPLLPPASVPTQDSEYVEWAVKERFQLYDPVMLLAEACKSMDFAGMEIYAGTLYDDTEKALNEIDQFSVSSKLQPSKDEFKLALQDIKQMAYYIERGARNINLDDIETAAAYTESGIKHLNRSTALLPKEYTKKFNL